MAPDHERRRKHAQPSRKSGSALVVSALALPALVITRGQSQLDLIAGAVVVLILGLVALLRCRREDIPDIVRALMRMGPRDDKRDDDSMKPPPLPKP
jgi:hypothetical protein